MCGFIATFTDKPLEKCQADASLNRLRSRGPDGEGSWQRGGVFLGHRRLAILNLDDRAAQPMGEHGSQRRIAYTPSRCNVIREFEACSATFLSVSW